MRTLCSCDETIHMPVPDRPMRNSPSAPMQPAANNQAGREDGFSCSCSCSSTLIKFSRRIVPSVVRNALADLKTGDHGRYGNGRSKTTMNGPSTVYGFLPRGSHHILPVRFQHIIRTSAVCLGRRGRSSPGWYRTMTVVESIHSDLGGDTEYWKTVIYMQPTLHG